MVTVAIAVILLGIGVPSLNGLFQSMSADASVNRIMREIRFARSQAIDLNQPVVICALAANGSDCGGNMNAGLTVFADDNGNNKLDAGEKVLQAANPFNKAGNTGFVGGITHFTFGTDGLNSSLAGSVYFCSNDNNYIDGVVVTMGGNVRFVTDSERASCPL